MGPTAGDANDPAVRERIAQRVTLVLDTLEREVRGAVVARDIKGAEAVVAALAKAVGDMAPKAR
jgi:hypothetical protein